MLSILSGADGLFVHVYLLFFWLIISLMAALLVGDAEVDLADGYELGKHPDGADTNEQRWLWQCWCSCRRRGRKTDFFFGPSVPYVWKMLLICSARSKSAGLGFFMHSIARQSILQAFVFWNVLNTSVKEHLPSVAYVLVPCSLCGGAMQCCPMTKRGGGRCANLRQVGRGLGDSGKGIWTHHVVVAVVML